MGLRGYPGLLQDEDQQDLTAAPNKPIQDVDGEPVVQNAIAADRDAKLKEYLKKVRDQRNSDVTDSGDSRITQSDRDNLENANLGRSTVAGLSRALNFTGLTPGAHKQADAAADTLDEQSKIANAAFQQRGQAQQQNLLTARQDQQDAQNLLASDEAATDKAETQGLRRKADARTEQAFQRTEAVRTAEADPTSPQSAVARDVAIKYAGGGPKAQAQFANMSAQQIQTMLPQLSKIYELKEKDRSRQDELRAKRDMQAAASEAKIAAASEKNAEKEQGLETPYGQANTKDDAKQLKEAHESKQAFDAKIQELIDLRKKYGGELFNREAVARGKQLSKDLLLEYKNMAKLGVLSKSDEDIINAIIPSDPLAFTAASVTGQDPILTQLTKFKEDSARDFATKVKTRTRAGMAEYNNPTAGKAPTTEADLDKMSDAELAAFVGGK